MPEARSNTALYERACRVIPGGVSSPVRAFGSVGGTPYFVERARGSRVWDVEGREYVDYVQSYGASILGHADPGVAEAVCRAAAQGSSYGAPTEREVLLAEAICARVGGCEQVRLVSSGTEAVMTAVRLARGVTGRDEVLKFAGCYHGHCDALLAAAGSGMASLGLPGSAGVPPSAVAATVVAPYNRVPEIGERTACVIVEPVAANMGVVPPEPGFLAGLRGACDAAGALLVFDEVITGFRIGAGAASDTFGVRPDLWCFGKVIGGGLPLAAVGGRREAMLALAPVGPVYQAGTLSGNPLATAAGLAVLERLDAGAYAELERIATRLASGLVAAAKSARVPLQVPRVGPLLGLFLSGSPVGDYGQAQAAAGNGLYPRLFRGLLERGVALAPGPYEALFPSLSHSDADVDRTAEAAEEVFAAIAATL